MKGLLSGLRLCGIAGAVAAVAFLVPIAYGAMNEDHPAGSIGSGYAELTEDHLLNPGLIRAFIPTQSVSRRCLVTLSESTFGQAGTTVFCGARQREGVDGLLITLLLPSEAPEDLYVALTVYQQFAKGYGQPVLYTGD